MCEVKQSVEVLKDIRPLAERAAAVAVALAHGQPIDDDDGVIEVPVVLVTRANVGAVVVQPGFHAASALPACTL